MRMRLTQQMNNEEPDQLDDLLQEASVRLLRAVRKTRPDDLEALMATITRRTWTDYLRRKITGRKYFAPVSEDGPPDAADPSSMPGDDLGELRDRLELMVQELFDEQGHEDCRRLAIAYFDSRDWQEVSEEWQLSYAAVRKRWSRCLGVVRDALSSDPDYGHLISGTQA